MKPIQLIAKALMVAGLTTATLGRFGGEYQVKVNSVEEVFKAEAVAEMVKATYGLTLYVAF